MTVDKAFMSGPEKSISILMNKYAVLVKIQKLII